MNDIYISYKQKGIGEIILKEIELILNSTAYNVIYDKKNNSHNGANINSFQEKLIKAEQVILILSSDYCTSDNTMKEILGLTENSFAENVYLIVTDCAKSIANREKRVEIESYWKNKYLLELKYIGIKEPFAEPKECQKLLQIAKICNFFYKSVFQDLLETVMYHKHSEGFDELIAKLSTKFPINHSKIESTKRTIGNSNNQIIDVFSKSENE